MTSRLTLLLWILISPPISSVEDDNRRSLLLIIKDQLAEVRVKGAPELLRICAYPEGQNPPIEIVNMTIESWEKANWDIEPLREYGDERSKVVFLREKTYIDPVILVFENGIWKWVLDPGDEKRLLGKETVEEYRNIFDFFEKTWSPQRDK